MAEEKRLPSMVLRSACDIVIDTMGENGLKLFLRKAGLERYIGTLPPMDESPSITVEEYSNVIYTVYDLLGDRGAKAGFIRAGRNALGDLQKTRPVLFTAAGAAFKLMPSDMKIKIILEALAKELTAYYGSTHRVLEEGDAFILEIEHCPYCAKIKTDHPVCYIPIGFYSEVVKWATGKTHAVVEETCSGKGDPTCRFRISKKATE